MTIYEHILAILGILLIFGLCCAFLYALYRVSKEL